MPTYNQYAFLRLPFAIPMQPAVVHPVFSTSWYNTYLLALGRTARAMAVARWLLVASQPFGLRVGFAVAV